MTRSSGTIGAAWGVTGVMAMLAYAIVRVGGRSLEALDSELAWYHWIALVVSVAFMAYSEGYRGFQKGFSPRVVARARHLAAHPRPLHVLLAPLFCVGYFHATRRRLRGTYMVTAMIIGLVLAVRQMPQPWRGIVGAGVVVGLGWGIVSLAAFALAAINGDRTHVSPEVPLPTA